MDDVDDLYGYSDEDDDELAMEDDDGDDDEGWQDQVEDYMLPRRSPVISAINKDSLSMAQQQDLSMVMGLFNIKQHHARGLLIHYRWNTGCLGDHLERKGQERMLMEAGVVLQPQQQQQQQPQPQPQPQEETTKTTTVRRSSRLSSSKSVISSSKSVISSSRSSVSVRCEVCFEDFPPSSVSRMDCGHSFCDDCWTEHFVAAVDLGQKQIRCMAFRCPAICDESVVQRLLGRRDPAAAKRLHDMLLQSYVDDNSAVCWCPSVPHCGRAIRVDDAADEVLCEVRCPCGAAFCFRCAGPAHSPCPCPMWDRWEAKSVGEAENVKWLLANTKNCPKCFKPIHKVDGCNLVTCKCGQPFCWLCGGATGSAHTWTSIDNHSCNRFEREEKRKVDDAKREVLRYEHYYQRFHQHDLSHRAERDKLGPDVAARAARLEDGGGGGALTRLDAAWLTDAHGSLLWCRQVLARSYVFAYYMFDAEATPTRKPPETETETETKGLPRMTMAQKQALFEDYQEQVEVNVERLSKLLGTDVPELTEPEIMEMKQDATNRVRVLEAHCDKMYGCIQDELLPMLVEQMSIVAYQPGGPTKANELPA